MEKRFSEIDKNFWIQYGLQQGDLRQIESLDEYIKGLTEGLESLVDYPSGDSIYTEPKRDSIFVCYSHKDDLWRVELTKVLRTVSDQLKLWDDTKIRPGDEWRAEIERALASAKAAVLLVSPDFLDSDFIVKNELPPLLEAAKKGGCRILWINVKQSLVKYTQIAKYQALYDKTSLVSLKTDDERGEALHQIGEAIAEIYAGA